MKMIEPWVPCVLEEIEKEIPRKLLTTWEKGFLENIKRRVYCNINLSEDQIRSLRRLHQRVTEITKLRRN